MRTQLRRSNGLRRAVLGTAGADLGGMFAAAMAAADVPAAAGGGTRCCSVVELRQYTLHTARFDAFNALFEREFIEPQEAAGITVVGQFRDLDDPDRFVWLRGFRDMSSRAVALEAFYGGALWKSLRDQANANFTDTDNVLLLRPASADGAIDLDGFGTIDLFNDTDTPEFVHWHGQIIPANIDGAALFWTLPRARSTAPSVRS